jgi:lipopolysaccharide/colanic/teichoic acid biosynthesis glycosyltransferase
MAIDLDYVARRTFWSDLKILARTVPVMVADVVSLVR